jgi:hypothetical protein
MLLLKNHGLLNDYLNIKYFILTLNYGIWLKNIKQA